MDSNTISGRIVRVVLAGTLAAAAGIGLVACQGTPAAAEREPAIYEDRFSRQERIDQANADFIRERFAGRPVDRIEEELAREDAIIKEVLRLNAGTPADRIEEALERALRR